MIYLDHAATSPLRREVLEVMWPYLTTAFGNPSSTHELGRLAKIALEDARKSVAAVLQCSANEIIFTSGGTEADNLAIAGIALAHPRGRRIVTTKIEHLALLETCEMLRRNHDFEIVYAPVDSEGAINLEELPSLLTEDTTLCSVMYANNEVGTVQPIAAVGALCRSVGVPFHTDAVQAAGLLSLYTGDINIDSMSISAHKFGGPKGVGALFVKSHLMPDPVIYGGGQERGLRSGTENLASIVGLAAALALAESERPTEAPRLAALRDRLIDGVLRSVEGAVLTGSRNRLPNHASFCIAGTFGESVLVELENDGIICSSGSACSAGSADVSHVLSAMNIDDDLARTALRFTLGRETSDSDVDELLEALPRAVAGVRALA